MWILFILGILVIYIVFVINKNYETMKVIKTTREKQENYIRENGITKSADFEWNDAMNQLRYRVIADDKTQKIYISKGIAGDTFDEIPYEEIIGFEVIEDSQVVGGIKRAVVGGVLAGVAGAIVGSQTANKTAVSSMKAVIYRENVANSQYFFIFIGTKTKTTDMTYISAKRFTDNINATLKAVMAKTDHMIRPQQWQASAENFSQQGAENDVMESLKSLKTAYENDLITEAEYEEKKKDLLKKL